MTPFKVEFARESQKRAGAPTLVPVEVGGANVRAQIHVISADLSDGMNRLWRRERNIVGQTNKIYSRPKNPGKDHVLVDTLENFHGVARVLYTRIGQNIENPTAAYLAKQAITSARKLDDGRDGISYLIAATHNGVVTPLSGDYQQEVLRLTGATSLEQALAIARA